MPWSALTQIQAFPRRHTRHTCPHDPKDLLSHATTDGKCRAPPLSVFLTEGPFLRNGSKQLIRVQYGSDQGLESALWTRFRLRLADPATKTRDSDEHYQEIRRGITKPFLIPDSQLFINQILVDIGISPKS